MPINSLKHICSTAVFPTSAREIHSYYTKCYCYLLEGQAMCKTQDCKGRVKYFVLSNLCSVLKQKLEGQHSFCVYVCLLLAYAYPKDQHLFMCEQMAFLALSKGVVEHYYVLVVCT